MRDGDDRKDAKERRLVSVRDGDGRKDAEERRLVSVRDGDDRSTRFQEGIRGMAQVPALRVHYIDNRHVIWL